MLPNELREVIYLQRRKQAYRFFTASADSDARKCVLCKEKQPLSASSKFKVMTHEEKKKSTGHFIKDCKSLHRCRVCQNPHHTLLHIERMEIAKLILHPISSNSPTPVFSSHSAMKT